ncbi:MAG: anti-sigma factor [Sphingobacterium sp.]
MDIKEYISSGIIESYVLGLATEEEVSILECVRQKNPEVEQAIRDMELSLENLASQQATMPSESLESAIWDRISASQAESPATQQVTDPAFATNGPTDKIKTIRPQSRKLQPLWVAASVLLVGSLAINIMLFKNRQQNIADLQQANAVNQESENRLAEANQRWAMLQRPSVKMVTLQGVEKYPELKALVFWDIQTSEVLLAAENLPTVPSDKQYQLWAIIDGKPVDAGVLPLSRSDNSLLEMQRISGAQAFAITLEKAGGSTTPTLSDMFVIGNI